MQKDTEGTNEISFASRINIGPVEDFEKGISIDSDLAMGKDAESILDSLPDYFKQSVATFGFELHLNNTTSGASICETLEGLLQMASAVPQLAQLLEIGLSIKFRHVGASVFIDVSLLGQLGDQVLAQLNYFNLETLNFTGTGAGSLHLGVKPTDFLNCTLSELIQKAVNIKIESRSEFANTKHFISALVAVYQSMGELIPPQIRNFIGLLKFFGAVRKLDYEFKYDAKELCQIVTEIAGSYLGGQTEGANPLEAYGEQLAGMQGMGVGMIDQVKPMADAVIEPYKPSLSAVNFDRISLNGTYPKMKLHYKLSLNLPGITAFLTENFLS